MAINTIVPTDIEVSFGEIIDGIEKDGWEQSFGALWPSEEVKTDGPNGTYYVEPENVKRACAFAQGMMNVNVMKFSGEDPNWGTLKALYEFVSRLNDVDRKPIKEIADEARKEFEYALDARIGGWTFETCKNNYVPNGAGAARGS